MRAGWVALGMFAGSVSYAIAQQESPENLMIGGPGPHYIRAGKVGIGTTAPSETVEITGVTSPTLRIRSARPDGVNVLANAFEAESAAFGTQSPHPLLLYTEAAQRIRIEPGINGNVGIGTRRPGSHWSSAMIPARSLLEVGASGYFQFGKTSSGRPPATDCNEDAERGRMALDVSLARLYICRGVTRGWDYIALND